MKKCNTRNYGGIWITTDDGIKRNFRADWNMIYELDRLGTKLSDIKKDDDLTVFILLFCGLKHENKLENKYIDLEILEVITKQCFDNVRDKIIIETMENLIDDYADLNSKYSKGNGKSEDGYDFDYFYYVYYKILKLKGDFWKTTLAMMSSLLKVHNKLNSVEKEEKVSIDKVF